MAPRKRKSAANGEGQPAPTAMDKIARLLAVVATKDMDTEEAALKLDAIGFSALDISALLSVNANFVHTAKHRQKSRKGRAKNVQG